MAEIIPDTIDFGAYVRDTNPRMKVKAAGSFVADLVAAFAPEDSGPFRPSMFSTKLRDRLKFRPGEVTVWAGYSGHRKSMFTGQLALDLCVQRQRVLICSMEMKPADTLARMARQCFGVARPAVPSLERFSQWTDGRLWLFDHMGRLSTSEMLAVIRYFAQECEGGHVFIDSMMMVCQSEEHLDEQKQFATDVVRIAQELGIHVHLVAHCRKPSTAQNGDEKPPTKYDLRGSAAVSDQAHNVVMVWANKAKHAALERDPLDPKRHDADALVIVDKQRNGSWEGRAQMWFNDAGLRFVDSYESPSEPYTLRDE